MRVLLVPFALLAFAPALVAQNFDFGARLDGSAARGKPVNDVLGFDLFGRWHFAEAWSAELLVVHSPEFDVEGSPEYVGIETADVVDSTGTMTSVLLLFERRFGNPARRTEWFWGAGGGFSSVDVEDVAGSDVRGSPFTIVTDAGTEPVLAAVAGLRVRVTRSLGFEITVRAAEHFADWKFRDAVSGAEGSQDSFLLTGIQLGASWRF